MRAKGTTGKLNEMMAKAPNRYKMVHNVAKRAKQIMDGTAQTADELTHNRAIEKAIREFIAEDANK